MKKKKYILALTMVVSMVISLPAYAHSGKTDAFGGHRDNNNVSGLGYYHYHCGGHPAHLHPGGICPYATAYSEIVSSLTTEKTKPTTVSTSSTTKQSNNQSSMVNTQQVPIEVPTKVTVDGEAIAGPVLWYKNNYFVPVNQLANLLSASVLPVNEKLELPVKKGEGHTYIQTVPDYKSQYMDMFVVFVSMYDNDPYYHKIDCPQIEENGGLANYLSIDEGFFFLGEFDSVSPCPICIP